ncbi:MAG: imidazolonepropionase, partial [Flammeovirgaceae bacterium]|nr:imidazolonepropionase [Flammeovirgaceae bacterium]MDW8288006.1 imidazolonepropionase [Flammeovirgaceae bacterium]
LCFAGSRAIDYDKRIAGASYLEIAQSGGGIWDSVQKTRRASEHQLAHLTAQRANRHLSEGVTTIEVKSGYGLSVAEETKLLQAIAKATQLTKADLIPTCLAAHILPKDFDGDEKRYLEIISHELLPLLKQENLTQRVDIFVEQGAFSYENAKRYLLQANLLGFELTVHADQFSIGGSQLAVELNARSADHLEASKEPQIRLLAHSNTVAIALPGASLGLGMAYAPARQLLDNGAILAIASDWNPGSAPMGDLLTQAALLSAAEKLTAPETFAALTFRAAHALGLSDRGKLDKNLLADFQAYPCDDYREILYHQGKMKPISVWKKGERCSFAYNQFMKG